MKIPLNLSIEDTTVDKLNQKVHEQKQKGTIRNKSHLVENLLNKYLK